MGVNRSGDGEGGDRCFLTMHILCFGGGWFSMFKKEMEVGGEGATV